MSRPPLTFLCGPLSGYSTEARAADLAKFDRAARALEGAGHRVVSAADVWRFGAEWSGNVRTALTLMLSCDRVALLPGSSPCHICGDVEDHGGRSHSLAVRGAGA